MLSWYPVFLSHSALNGLPWVRRSIPYVAIVAEGSRVDTSHDYRERSGLAKKKKKAMKKKARKAAKKRVVRRKPAPVPRAEPTGPGQGPEPIGEPTGSGQGP